MFKIDVSKLLAFARTGVTYEQLAERVQNYATAYGCTTRMVWRELNRAAGDLP